MVAPIIISCTAMLLCKCASMEKDVCVFSYCDDILTPLLFRSNTRVNWSTAGERTFKLWEHGDSNRQSCPAQPAVNRHRSSKCLEYGGTPLMPLSSPPSSLLFFVSVVKTCFQRKQIFTQIQQCFQTSPYISGKSACILSSRALIFGKTELL